jgi:hypothetical protein
MGVHPASSQPGGQQLPLLRVLRSGAAGVCAPRGFTPSTPRSMLDWFLGYFLFAFLFLLSFIFVVDKVQGALLFNMKFAKALEVRAWRVLRGQ